MPLPPLSMVGVGFRIKEETRTIIVGCTWRDSESGIRSLTFTTILLCIAVLLLYNITEAPAYVPAGLRR